MNKKTLFSIFLSMLLLQTQMINCCRYWSAILVCFGCKVTTEDDSLHISTEPLTNQASNKNQVPDDDSVWSKDSEKTIKPYNPKSNAID